MSTVREAIEAIVGDYPGRTVEPGLSVGKR